MTKNIFIIGVGGRTGVMYARELYQNANITGVGMPGDAARIANGEIKVLRGGFEPETLRVKVIDPNDFGKAVETQAPDFILLAVRNPVNEAVKSYYRYFKGASVYPALILSQNGLSVVGDAKTALSEVLGKAADKVRIIRVSLINGVDAVTDTTGVGISVFKVSYKLPIKIGCGAVNFGNAADLMSIMRSSQMKCGEFEGKKVFEMEYSKLFTNLIGMAAAIEGVAVDAGLRDKTIFKKEVAMLREYVMAVRAAKGNFSNFFCGYPIKFLAMLMTFPVSILVPFRGLLASVVVRGRNRPKDLSEIDYYNGEVVRLGKRFGISVPVNEKITKEAKNMMVRFLKRK